MLLIGSERLVANERTKLTAAWLNTLATAIIAAGVFAPIAASIYGVSHPAPSGISFLLLTLACFAVGISLHVVGRFVLGRLRE